MNCLADVARLALDLAAPVERARAPLHHDHLLRPVAATAAHQVAAVDADRGVVALAAVRALDAESRVLRAEVRRRLQVDEIAVARRNVLRVVGLQLELVAVD